MTIQIQPGKLAGRILPAPSKSQAHRLLICAALAEGTSTLTHVDFSGDICATLRCMEALGARWSSPESGTVCVTGVGGHRVCFDALPRLDCSGSGSTLRFFLPLTLAVAGGGILSGTKQLMERPLEPYLELLTARGIIWKREGTSLLVQGRLTPGEYRLPGHISSQFFTGLLLALPLLKEPSAITAVTPLESQSYLDLTLDALAGAGISVSKQPGSLPSFRVAPSHYHAFDRSVEPDWSQAAFWFAARHLGSSLQIGGLNPDSLQGDRVIAPLAARLALPGDLEISLSDCPDLLPPLAVMAAVRQGTTVFTNAARLRLKESDRLQTTAAMLRALGGRAEEMPDGLRVRGGPLSGGTADGSGDHRIVMAAAVAATACSGPVTILGAEAVQKSYPAFFDDFRMLGGDAIVL